MNLLTPSGRFGLAAATVSLVLLSTACEEKSEGQGTGQGASANPAASESLKKYYDQDLKFRACDTFGTTAAEKKLFAGGDFECGRLTVPLDYEHPDGKTAKIAVLRVAARGHSKGPLMVNPGGPGIGGMQFVASQAKFWGTSKLGENFDVIGFDPRGISNSTPTVDCYTQEEFDAQNTQLRPFTKGGPITPDQARMLAERCVEGSGGEDVLQHMGTREGVRDLDVLRGVLGDKKLSYLGQSYGTRLGAVYAQTFPQNVRAITLDASVPPRQSIEEQRVAQYVALQNSFDSMAKYCAKDNNCPLGTNPEKATEEFQKIAQPLFDKPVPAGGGRFLPHESLISAVSAGMYDELSWPTVIKGIAEIKQQGKGAVLRALADAYAQRSPEGEYSNFIEANLAVNCMDEQRTSPNQELGIARDIYKAAPYTDPGKKFTEAANQCQSWPAKPTLPSPLVSDVSKDLPDVLTVAVTGDPSTPFSAGEEMSKAIGGAFLKVNGEKHTSTVGTDNTCINGVVNDYFIELKKPEAGKTCTL